jgi:hypothetical protein
MKFGRYLRYSLAGLVLLALAVVGYKSGNRDGYRTGYLAAYQAGHDSELSKLGPPRRVHSKVREYDVARLLQPVGSTPRPEDPYVPLIDLVTSLIAADTWEASELAWIRANREEQVLIVSQSDGVHAEIETLLTDLHSSRDECDKRIANNQCLNCGEAPLPRLGEKCTECGKV